MNKKRMILSTGNLDKIEEIRGIFRDLPLDIISKNDLGLGDIEIEEDGKTLEENAIKKARAIKERTEGIIIADDSGLYVDYLNGAPGLYSARYAGKNPSYLDNNMKLLRELEGVPLDKRGAYFKTVIAMIEMDGKINTFIGKCKGAIGFEPRGNRGFGYDPLFIVSGYDKTFAELGDEIKNKISHRAIALDKLKKRLKEILGDG